MVRDEQMEKGTDRGREWDRQIHGQRGTDVERDRWMERVE